MVIPNPYENGYDSAIIFKDTHAAIFKHDVCIVKKIMCTNNGRYFILPVPKCIKACAHTVLL